MFKIYRTILGISLALAGLLLLFWLMGPGIHASSGSFFVAPDGTGTACTQAQPCALATALAQATDGSTLYLARGTYTGTGAAVIAVNKSIALYGGWDGSPTGPVIRDPDVHPIVLDGEGLRRVVYITGPATVTLEGLTIANGRVVSTTTPIQGTRWGGGGLYAKDATLTLHHTRFYSNVVNVYDVDSSYAYGGGAAVEGGSLVVEDTIFRWNGATARISSFGGGLSISGTLTATVTNSLFQDNDAWHAGGLYFRGTSGGSSHITLRDSTFLDNGRRHSAAHQWWGGYAAALEVVWARASIEGNTFVHNRASNDYGAVAVYFSNLKFSRNLLGNNSCARVSAMYLNGVSPFTVTNNIVTGNESTYTWLRNPVVQVRGGNGQFLHNTIARNASTYGLLVGAGATVTLTNTIIVSHTVGITVTAGSTARLEGTLWGSGPWANGTDWGGDGTILTGTVNVWGNPAFVNPDEGDYHIGPDSAARDAGVDAGVTTDIDGDPRPLGPAPDIGADEYIGRVHRFWLPMVFRK